MGISSWGNFPKVNCKVLSYRGREELRNIVRNENNIIPYGNGRSYGDSALSSRVVPLARSQKIISFDESEGLLNVSSGTLLKEIIDLLTPKGWFFGVTPGTKLITVGGAIASDVHGKNHHLVGCFSNFVHSLNLMLPNGEIINCSKSKNKELFNATCGGMGLTGFILNAKIKLVKIKSKNVVQKTIKTSSLEEIFNCFEENKKEQFSLAWIDCLSTKDNSLKGLFTLGNFCKDEDLDYREKLKLKVPFFIPSFFLFNWIFKLFNFLYLLLQFKKTTIKTVDIDAFFYPLDRIKNWNKLYGRKGFIQYQFVIPYEVSFNGISEILDLIRIDRCKPTLAVIKLFGKSNNNYLSFPMYGYTLSLDFKITSNLFPFLRKLDFIIRKYNGRLYLAKDSRVAEKDFESGYEKIQQFRDIRKRFGMNKKFNSYQSLRLKI